MKKKPWIAFSIVTALTVGAGVFLAGFGQAHVLGEPGLKMSHLYLYDENGKLARTNSIYLPEKVLNYQSEPLPVTREELDWLPPDTSFGRRSYKAPDDFELMLSAVMMGTDRTSIHQPQYCVVGQGFSIDKSELVTIPVDDPEIGEIPAMKLTTTRKDNRNGKKIVYRAILVYWFVSKDQMSARHWERMLWMAEDLITEGVLQRWAYVVCAGFCRPGQEERTYERMKEFLAVSVPEFQWVNEANSPDLRAEMTGGE